MTDAVTKPSLSARVTGLAPGGDDGWGLYYRARDLAASGTPVTMLTIGDHDIKTDPSILDAMNASARGGNLGYASLMGSPALRAAVAKQSARQTGVATGPEQVIITPGGQAAIFAAMTAVLEPGDACIVLDPYYATFAQTVVAAGGTPIVVPTRAEDDFQPDIDAIAAAITPRTRAILINSPNNPSGAVYTAERLEALSRLAVERNLWVISDELYAAQVHDGPHLSPRGYPGMADRTLVIGSMSKSHAMTGCRVGWAVGPERAIERLGDLAIATTYGIPGFLQDAATFALTEGDAIVADIAARYRRRRDLALRALGNGAGARAIPPAGGMYLMIDIRATGLSGTAFAEALLDKHRIAVMPGESFGSAAAGHLRVALTVEDSALGAAMQTLGAFAAERLGNEITARASG